MTQRYFDGRVPDPGELAAADTALLATIEDGFDSVGNLYDSCKFRAALQESLALATRVNQYLEEMGPWRTIKTDKEAAGRALYVAIQAISGLKILFAPVLPFTSQQTHELLGEEGQLFGRQLVETYDEETRSHTALTYDGSMAVGRWENAEVPAGRVLPGPSALFRKLDPATADDELARLQR
jgi:methionyl-tRNA synthetase